MVKQLKKFKSPGLASDEKIGVEQNIKMKLFTLLLLITSVLFIPSCGQFNLSGDRNGRGGDDRDDDLDLDPINGAEISNALSDMKNCAEYEGGHNPFRLFNVLGEAVEQLENCISKAMDKSIGRICAEEKKLDKLAKKHRNNDAAMEQIEEYRDSLAYLKEDTVDQILVIADIFDEVEYKLGDKIDEKFDSDTLIDILLGGTARLAVSSEVGGFTRFFEFKARTLCGYNIFEKGGRDSRRDSDNRRDDDD